MLEFLLLFLKNLATVGLFALGALGLAWLLAKHFALTVFVILPVIVAFLWTLDEW